MMAKRASLYEWADDRLAGELAAKLQAWRDEEPPLTLDQIARRLEDDHGVTVSRETVRRWAERCGVSFARPAA